MRYLGGKMKVIFLYFSHQGLAKMLILGGKKLLILSAQPWWEKCYKKCPPQALTVKMLGFSILSVQGSESGRLRVN